MSSRQCDCSEDIFYEFRTILLPLRNTNIKIRTISTKYTKQMVFSIHKDYISNMNTRMYNNTMDNIFSNEYILTICNMIFVFSLKRRISDGKIPGSFTPNMFDSNLPTNEQQIVTGPGVLSVSLKYGVSS